MNSLRISTGMTTSAARRSRPLCNAQSAATWNRTTLPAMSALREKPRTEGGDGEKRSDTIEHSSAGRRSRRRVQQTAGCYLRKIHQAEPLTMIRLMPRAEKSSMSCFP